MAATLHSFARISALLALASLTVACSSAPSPSPTQILSPPSATHTPPAPTPSPVPSASPTPEVIASLRQGVTQILGVQPYTAETIMAQYSKTTDAQQSLLASVPPEEQVEFLRDYLLLPAARHVMRERALDPGICHPRSYLAIDPGQLMHREGFWEKGWGPPPDRFWEHMPPEWQVSLEDPIVIDCDNPADGLEQISAFEAQALERIDGDEDIAEAILGDLLRRLIADSLGREVSPQIEFVPSLLTEIIIYRSDTGLVLSSDYYPIDPNSLNRQQFFDQVDAELLEASPLYDIRLTYADAVALGPNPEVPILLGMGDTTDSPSLITSIVRQLVDSSPVAALQETDASAMVDAFIAITGYELERDWFKRDWFERDQFTDPSGFDLFWQFGDPHGDFDSTGRHLAPEVLHHIAPSSRLPGAPDPASFVLAVFQFRNCTVGRGEGLAAFFERVSSAISSDEVLAMLASCDPDFGPTATSRADLPAAGDPGLVETPTSLGRSNLITNPSFEDDPTQASLRWLPDDAGGSDLLSAWAVYTARTGLHSIQLTASTPGINGWPWWRAEDLLLYDRNHTYTFSAWALTPDSAKAMIWIDYLDSMGSFMGGVSTGCDPLPEAGTWQKLDLEIPPMPARASYLRLGLRLCLGSNEGKKTTLFYDDVYFGVLPR